MNQLFKEYDEILIGKRDVFSQRFFGKENSQSKDNAIQVLRYAFTNYLRWPPEMIEAHIGPELLDKLRLTAVVKYIPFPIEYDRDKDYYYFVTLAFNRHHLSYRDKTIHTYERVLSNAATKYPKDYFTGSAGIVRAGICLQYLISHFVMFSSINELYQIFASEEGYVKLHDYKLLNACRDTFDTPVDFLHFILPEEQRNQLYFHFYKFKYLKEMVNENGRKRRSETNYVLKGDLA